MSDILTVAATLAAIAIVVTVLWIAINPNGGGWS